jgi:hypothetical protein
LKLNLKGSFLVAVAIASGLLVLVGYFIPALSEISGIFLRWAMLLTAVQLLVGVINLLRTHWKKFTGDQPGKAYSLVVVISFGIVLLIAAPFGPTGQWSLWLFNNIQVPIEASLMGILAIVLVYACARMFNRRSNVYSVIFVGTILLVLIGTASLPGMDLIYFRELKDWISRVWSVAGARGILLGVGLGTVAASFRVLMGVDRPYGG